MSYTEPRGDDRLVKTNVYQREHHARISWGPIIAGIFVAIATQLVLSALGIAIGLTIGVSGAVGIGVSIWSIISLLIALFIGSWVAAAGCEPMNNKTAMLHGLILWATTLAISAWLLSSGVSGAFGLVASNAGEVLGQVQQPGGVSLPDQAPNISPNQVQQAVGTSAKVAWSFIIGSLLGLAASLIGATVGAKKPRAKRHDTLPNTTENIVR